MRLLLALLLCQFSAGLELPAGFDPAAYYLPSAGDRGDLESPRGAAELAEGLVAHDAPESLAVAESVLGAVLDAQETREGAAHRGNFRWRFAEGAIGDLNSVEFTLRHLIPLMIAHGDRLSGPLRARMDEAIRLGLEEIARKNVDISYTNVAAMDCMNSILGGEWLGADVFSERGYARLNELEAETLSHGTFREYNTPTYTRVTHEAMTRIARYTTNSEAAVRARALRARLALTAALHLHPGSGRWAGPHGRGHYLSRPAEIEAERGYLDQWIAMGNAPAGFQAMLDERPLPYSVWESAHEGLGLGLMTWMDEAFTMGTSTREISRQSSVFLVQGMRTDGARPALAYAKYLIDSPEDGGEASARMGRNEQGKFLGVQWGTRAIGLYAPRTLEHPGSVVPASLNRFRSAKAVVEFSGREENDGQWAGTAFVGEFPHALGAGEVVVVECGSAFVAIRPLSRDDLGHGAPLRLVRRDDGVLALEMYNYLGPETVFWEMDRESRFFQGKPRCGFYAETAPVSAYADGAAFAREVASGSFVDEASPPVTSYHDGALRAWTVGYERGGKTLGIEIDLLAWSLTRRWTEAGPLGWPLLESPLARQNESGHVEVGGASLTCGPHPAWLFSLPESDVYVAGYHGEAAPFTLETPSGRVEVPSMGTGVVTWRQGEVDVDALYAGEISIKKRTR